MREAPAGNLQIVFVMFLTNFTSHWLKEFVRASVLVLIIAIVRSLFNPCLLAVVFSSVHAGNVLLGIQ